MSTRTQTRPQLEGPNGRSAGRRGKRVVFVQNGRQAHHPRHHHRLAAALAAAGYEAITLAQPDPEPGHIDAVPVKYLPVRRNRFTRMASAPLTMWRVMRLNPWAVHVLTLELLPWGVLLKHVRRCHVLYDSNDQYDSYMLYKEWLPRRLRPLLRTVVHRAEPWLAARLDAATTALPATQEKFLRAGVRSVLVRNFPPTSIVAPRGERPFAFDVLLGGSIHGLEGLLAATAAELEKLRPGRTRWLVVARNQSPSDQAALDEALREHGVRERFELLHDRPYAEMRDLMAVSRIGLVMYLEERVPQRMFEYMASGIPFVVSDLPTTTQFTRDHGVALLAKADDPRSYASALASLLDDENRQRQMSERGRRVARECYSWESESRKLVALYEDLLASTDIRSPLAQSDP